jgi:hypothetical protein
MLDLSKQGTDLTDLLDSERVKKNTVPIRGRIVEIPEGKIQLRSGTLVLNPNEKWWTDLTPPSNTVCVISHNDCYQT